MSDPLAAIQNEQRRQSDEIAAMRAMHIELMQGVGTLCTKLGVLEVQYNQALSSQNDLRRTIKDHGAKIEELRLSQASSQYFVDLVKNLNRYVFVFAISAVGSLCAALYTASKGLTP